MPDAPTPALLALEGVSRSFPRPEGPPRVVLEGVDLRVDPGEVVAVVGRSGSGKSTLLHLAAGIDQPDAGRVRLGGRDLADLDEPTRCALRRDEVGLVFQFFHLLPHLSVRENVEVPAMISGDPPADAGRRADALLETVGLAGRGDDGVARLSGGEMQRVAICRALLREPRLVLADEPTGNLDDDSAEGVLGLLLDLARQRQVATVLVTHDRALAQRADRVLELKHGQLVTP